MGKQLYNILIVFLLPSLAFTLFAESRAKPKYSKSAKKNAVLIKIHKTCSNATQESMGLERSKDFCSCVVKNHNVNFNLRDLKKVYRLYNKKPIKNKEKIQKVDDPIAFNCQDNPNWQSEKLKNSLSKKEKK